MVIKISDHRICFLKGGTPLCQCYVVSVVMSKCTLTTSYFVFLILIMILCGYSGFSFCFSFSFLQSSQSTWCLYLESGPWYLIPQSVIAPFPCLPWRCWLRHSMVPKSLGHLSQACLVSSWIFLCVSKVALERRTLLQPLVGHGNLPVLSIVCLCLCTVIWAGN